MKWPIIIQGGMGAGVSGWRLAGAVSRQGQLGVVSGTALDVIVARQLQLGDLGGHRRRSFKQFPDQAMAQRVLDRYFIEGGKEEGAPFKSIPIYSEKPSQSLQELTIVSSFSEIYLAKEKHAGMVGVNCLEKIQLPILWTLYGAMLADVDYVLMGAGIPREIPGVLDAFSKNEPASLKIHAVDGGSDEFRISFDPKQLFREVTSLKRPRFLAIVASSTLATSLVKKATGRVDGFVVEGPTAGGHNAPPRGELKLNESDEPIYGEKDEVAPEKMRELGVPFWMAGGYGNPDKVKEAVDQGAAGVQVGTAFAFCEESGLEPSIKQRLIEEIKKGLLKIKTDARASASGFPFKVAELAGTLAESLINEQRQRICDLGYLRYAYKNAAGKLGFRCPAEPEASFLSKGGKPEEMEGRKCLCNGLMANIGLAQQRGDYTELPLVTLGKDLSAVIELLREKASYAAEDVIKFLLEKITLPQLLQIENRIYAFA